MELSYLHIGMAYKPNNKYVHVPSTSVQAQRHKPRINTSLDNKFNNSYLKNVKLNETLRVTNPNIFTNNFMVSNAIKLTPRQMNRRFGKHNN